jgi:hypothetical protein
MTDPQPIDGSPAEAAPGDVTTLEGCLTFCVNYNTIYFQAYPRSNAIFCVCETDATPQATRCGTGEDDNYYTMLVFPLCLYESYVSS